MGQIVFGLVIFALLYGIVDVYEKSSVGYYKRLDRWYARLFDMASDALAPLFTGTYYAFSVVCLILVLSFFWGWPLSW